MRRTILVPETYIVPNVPLTACRPLCRDRCGRRRKVHPLRSNPLHRTNPKCRSERARLESRQPFPVTRNFSSADLDVDDLAEAVRLLLGSGTILQVAAIDSSNRNLLCARPRVTHVVEAAIAA
jgi:hypothetical protein